MRENCKSGLKRAEAAGYTAPPLLDWRGVLLILLLALIRASSFIGGDRASTSPSQLRPHSHGPVPPRLGSAEYTLSPPPIDQFDPSGLELS